MALAAAHKAVLVRPQGVRARVLAFAGASIRNTIRSNTIQQPQQQQAACNIAARAPSILLRAGAARRMVCATAAAGGAGAGTEAIRIKVEGMMCGGCTSRVEEALKGMAGVKGVAVDLEGKTATVEVAGSRADADKMTPGFVDAIKNLGFEAEPAK